MATYPLDMLRSQLAMARDPWPSVRQQLVGLLWPTPCQTGTPRLGSLYVGLGATLAQIFPYMGLNFALYHGLVTTWDASDAPSWVLLAGGVAGVVAKTLVFPLDVLKRTQQLAVMTRGRHVLTPLVHTTTAVSLARVAVALWRDGGVRAFWKGLVPATLKAGLSSAAVFSLHHLVLQLLQLHQQAPGH